MLCGLIYHPMPAGVSLPERQSLSWSIIFSWRKSSFGSEISLCGLIYHPMLTGVSLPERQSLSWSIILSWRKLSFGSEISFNGESRIVCSPGSVALWMIVEHWIMSFIMGWICCGVRHVCEVDRFSHLLILYARLEVLRYGWSWSIES